MCPVNPASNECVRKRVNTLDKRYVIPSCNYFSKVALSVLYAKHQGEIERGVTAVECFGTTTDLRSSRTMEPYRNPTIHYIDGDFTMKFYPRDHTEESIAQELKETMASWSFHEKRHVCITTDNWSNAVEVASLNKWMRLQYFEPQTPSSIWWVAEYIKKWGYNLCWCVWIL